MDEVFVGSILVEAMDLSAVVRFEEAKEGAQHTGDFTMSIVFESGKAVISGVTDVEETRALVAWLREQLSARSGGPSGSDGSKVEMCGLDAKQID